MRLPDAIRHLSPDATQLFATRAIRLFAYGALSVVLVFYLVGSGLTAPQVGVLLTLTLIGDAVVSIGLTTRADRLGRRRILLVGAALMAGAGVVFAWTSTFWVLLAAATIGVISPSGQEVGPFLSVEQAAPLEPERGARRCSLRHAHRRVRGGLRAEVEAARYPIRAA